MPQDEKKKPEDEAKKEEIPATDLKKEEIPPLVDEKDDKKSSDVSQADENGKGSEETPADEVKADPTSEEKEREFSDGTVDNVKEQDPQKSTAIETADTPNIELLQARAELAAFKSGFRADAVEDAVCLAVNDAKKTGAVDETSVAEALKGVLERHPEWSSNTNNSAGFRVGADNTQSTKSSNDDISKIFGNK